MTRKYIAVLLLTGFVFIMYSCGGDYSAPVDATITIIPVEIAYSDGTGTVTTSSEQFTIAVKDANGIPLNDVEIWISYVWAIPNEYALVQLFDGDNPKDSPMSVTTDINGVYNLRFDFQSGGGLSYLADLVVTSGSVSASTEFSVDTGS